MSLDATWLIITVDKVDLPLSTSTLSGEFNQAIIRPLLKKTGIDASGLKNYRPVSNVTVLSKLSEVVQIRLLAYDAVRVSPVTIALRLRWLYVLTNCLWTSAPSGHLPSGQRPLGPLPSSRSFMLQWQDTYILLLTILSLMLMLVLWKYNFIQNTVLDRLGISSSWHLSFVGNQSNSSNTCDRWTCLAKCFSNRLRR